MVGGGANMAGVALLGKAASATVIAAPFLPALDEVGGGNGDSVGRRWEVGLGTVLLHR